jgi:hypothetical protein
LDLDRLEHRLCLSKASGIDALAIGDVNGDRVADIAVASHQGDHFIVTIYSGWGQSSASTNSGYSSLALVTLKDPLGEKSGPLDIALGDFNGSGVSQLAVATTTRATGAPKIGVWTFQVPANSSPVNSPVNAVPLTAPFTPAGYSSASGIHLAAADPGHLVRDRLYAVPGGASTGTISVLDYQASTESWSVVRKVPVPVSLKAGASLSVGDVTGDQVADLVVGSKSSGQTAIYDGARHRWVRIMSPLGKNARDVRVSVVSGEGTAGSVVVTSAPKKRGTRVVIIPYKSPGAHAVRLASSPGPGALVPLGAGYVYQRSTVKDASSTFSTSDGPATPTVIFGATQGNELVVQGFRTQTAPSKADVYVEPLWGSPTAGFIPLQPDKDSAVTGQSSGSGCLDSVSVNLIAFPEIAYHSPYQVTLPAVPNAPSVTQGLYSFSRLASTTQGAWGPEREANTPPSVPSSLTAAQAGEWLRERVIASLQTFIGADYQHHHDPRWLPAQGSAWNTTSTVAYQSQGIDCTNLTAFAYADAMGIFMTGDTGGQAAISAGNQQNITVPSSMSAYVSIQTIAKSTDYQTFTAQLKPGDIIYIDGNPKDPTQATHAITWLGQYGVDAATGKMVPLVIDSTGITPGHIDSNNHVVPEGIQIRPFGPPDSANSWYFLHVDHALRIIAD